MINLTDKINLAPLGSNCTPCPSPENPIAYKGWKIWRWTGWKGCDFEIETSDNEDNCTACGKTVTVGEKAILRQSVRGIVHSDCSDDPLKGQIFGQWLAYKGDYFGPDCQYAYASIPGGCGTYRKGDFFNIASPSQLYCHKTVKDELDYAREECLKKLKAYIDSVEDPV
jgi:hypothetical protein